MMPRRRRRNPEDELPYDEWLPTHAVKFNSDGTVSLMEEAGAIPNVAAGFIDEEVEFGPPGHFHPIRASYDYSRKRAGESTRRRRRNVGGYSISSPYGRISADAIVAEFHSIGAPVPYHLEELLRRGTAYSNEDFDALSDAMHTLEKIEGIEVWEELAGS